MKNICILFLLSIITICCSDKIEINAGEYNKDFSLGEIVPINSLSNPDRGFHLECNLFADKMISPWNSNEKYSEDLFLDKISQYGVNDGLTLVQQYIYLTKWIDSDLDEEALSNVRKIFELVKQNGLKMILRFAYNWEGFNTDAGESKKWILRHIEQLAPLLQEFIGQIAVLQIGFIGAWGEWHSSPLDEDYIAKSEIVQSLLSVYPEPYNLVIRHPMHKNKLELKNEMDYARIGYANDYFTAGEHENANGNDFVPGTEEYEQVKKEVDKWNFYMVGELPYNENTEMGLDKLLTPLKVLKILKEHKYSALDITQNFELNIENLKNRKIYPSLLQNMGIPYDKRYFLDGNGKEVVRSYFDFIRDHLGYRLGVQPNPIIQIKDKKIEYNIKITNTGFATVVNPKEFYMVLITENNQIKEFKQDINVREWYPSLIEEGQLKEYELKGYLPLDEVRGKCLVGIWIPDVNSSIKYDARYDIRLAEYDEVRHWMDDDGKYLVNIIGEVNN